MKHSSFITILLCMIMIISSCKKEPNSNDEAGFSQEIKNFVPQTVLDSLRKWGLKINAGKKPPVIEGIYNITPNICSFDNSGFNRAGNKFADYRLRFREQNNETLTISLDYKALNAADSAIGVGSFIAGNDNYFTVFVNASGVQEGISYKQIGFYSGRKTANGIEGLQHGFYFTEKGPDPDNKLVKPGTSRIFNDDDDLSEPNTFFRGVTPKSTLGAGK